ncbi:MAG: hypothetical protein ORN26_00445 [Candidatus Pacebacteria bacterium]|nr:hypothetical protein [Candidatus Paceibacterota bacterium]
MGILDFMLGKEGENKTTSNDIVINTSLKDTLAPSALKIDSKDFTIGDIKGRTFFVMTFPRFLTDN